MRVYYGKEKHLDISSAKRLESGDIEVLSSDVPTAISVVLVEYDLDWYVVIENPLEFPDDPPICAFQSYIIENQLDVYRLNASL